MTRMHDQIRELAYKAGGYTPLSRNNEQLILPNVEAIAKFVDLIKQSMYDAVVAHKSVPSALATEYDRAAKHWVIGYDSGITDVLCEIVNFGIDDVRK